MLSFVGVCFFFQAEDGIRDLVRSRGLGDVYKRQCKAYPSPILDRELSELAKFHVHTDYVWLTRAGGPVSYTHLTLPTIYSV